MTGKQRIATAINFQKPDRLPRFWEFWPEFEQAWQQAGHSGQNIHDYFGGDMRIVMPDETPWPTRAAVVQRSGTEAIVRTGWGELKRTTIQDGYAQQVLGEIIEVAFPERTDPDKMHFDDPRLSTRYEVSAAEVVQWKDRYFVLTKTGGPYLRASFLRGEENFLIDIVEDPAWARAFVERVTDHLTAVGVESIRRFNLQDTGLAIYDDVASTTATFISPKSYEQVCLPSLRRMVRAFRDAGASFVMHHSDGNVLALLDMWIDAGIQAINPLEYRAGMDPVRLRHKYGDKLVLVGGLDNCAILPRGDRVAIRDHIRYLVQAGENGGFVIGPHSIGSDVSVQTMEYVLELLDGHAVQVPGLKP